MRTHHYNIKQTKFLYRIINSGRTVVFRNRSHPIKPLTTTIKISARTYNGKT